MARKRMIDPSFWVDEKLGTVDPVVRLLFMGLISQADDEGRLNGHPSLVRSLIFPYDHSIQVDDVDEWLNLLATSERKVIVRYEVDHQKYILITNFKKHQTINKPQKSKLPNIPEHYGINTVAVNETYGNDTAQEKLKEEKLSEVEGKRSEESKPTHNFLPIINKLNLKCKGIWEMEQLESYLTTMDPELIEEALKRSEHKGSVAYALGILPDWDAKGLKTLEDIKPKVGDFSEKHQGQLQHGGNDSKNKSITGDAIGWLPSAARPANYTQLHQVSGQ